MMLPDTSGDIFWCRQPGEPGRESQTQTQRTGSRKPSPKPGVAARPRKATASSNRELHQVASDRATFLDRPFRMELAQTSKPAEVDLTDWLGPATFGHPDSQSPPPHSRQARWQCQVRDPPSRPPSSRPHHGQPSPLTSRLRTDDRTASLPSRPGRTRTTRKGDAEDHSVGLAGSLFVRKRTRPELPAQPATRPRPRDPSFLRFACMFLQDGCTAGGILVKPRKNHDVPVSSGGVITACIYSHGRYDAAALRCPILIAEALIAQTLHPCP